MSAFDAVIVGAGIKVFLHFPQRFWPSGVYAIRQQGAAGDAWHSWYDVLGSSGEPMTERVLGRPIDLGELHQHVPDSRAASVTRCQSVNDFGEFVT